jgi:hypothetical protein
MGAITSNKKISPQNMPIHELIALKSFVIAIFD